MDALIVPSWTPSEPPPPPGRFSEASRLQGSLLGMLPWDRQAAERAGVLIAKLLQRAFAQAIGVALAGLGKLDDLLRDRRIEGALPSGSRRAARAISKARPIRRLVSASKRSPSRNGPMGMRARSRRAATRGGGARSCAFPVPDGESNRGRRYCRGRKPTENAPPKRGQGMVQPRDVGKGFSSIPAGAKPTGVEFGSPRRALPPKSKTPPSGRGGAWPVAIPEDTGNAAGTATSIPRGTLSSPFCFCAVNGATFAGPADRLWSITKWYRQGHAMAAKTDDLRKNAEDCRRLAESTANSLNREHWLKMAEHWTRIAGGKKLHGSRPSCQSLVRTGQLWNQSASSTIDRKRATRTSLRAAPCPCFCPALAGLFSFCIGLCVPPAIVSTRRLSSVSWLYGMLRLDWFDVVDGVGRSRRGRCRTRAPKQPVRAPAYARRKTRPPTLICTGIPNSHDNSAFKAGKGWFMIEPNPIHRRVLLREERDRYSWIFATRNISAAQAFDSSRGLSPAPEGGTMTKLVNKTDRKGALGHRFGLSACG